MSSEDEPNQERTSRDERAGGRELKQLRDELDRAKIREDKLENKLTSLQTRLDEKESGDADPLNSSSKSGKLEQGTSLFTENSELPTDEFSANFGLPTGENFGPGNSMPIYFSASGPSPFPLKISMVLVMFQSRSG